MRLLPLSICLWTAIGALSLGISTWQAVSAQELSDDATAAAQPAPLESTLLTPEQRRRCVAQPPYVRRGDNTALPGDAAPQPTVQPESVRTVWTAECEDARYYGGGVPQQHE